MSGEGAVDLSAGTGSASGSATGSESENVRHFKFPSHQSHVLTLAKMCKENKEYTDCVIQCDEGSKIKAHKLVLGSASSFLKTVFNDLPVSLNEATIVVPGVREKARLKLSSPMTSL